MASSVAALRDRARSPGGQKAIRYTLVSIIAFAVFEMSLFVLLGLLHWSARDATILANVIGGVPSYYLNRRWAWGKRGRSHLMREVVPFWALAFISLAFSTWA
ncbi:MAG TPA: GtrA family protein, partial [Acidimicrobiales bacterium]|nr:GtrA family protein [Acidimicrobiales bacterium]